MMILTHKQIEEIAAAVTKDFNEFFFGKEANDVRIARATPIDQFAKDYRIPKAHLFTYLCIGCGEAVTA